MAFKNRGLTPIRTGTMHRVRLMPIAAVAALFALPASAEAVTFGANLAQRIPNSTATCGYPPYYPGIYPYNSSCTFFSTATPTGQAAETDVVPLPDPAAHGNQAGTITEVRIKTGLGQSGPAKLTVLRAHHAVNYGADAACCIGQAESAQFTLTPNSIVHVATNLPVESRYDAAQRIYSYDTLALSVLDSTTPIPAVFTGDPNGYCSGGYFPYIQTGQERFTGQYGICGFLVLMQADMTIRGGPSPPPAPRPPPRPPKIASLKIRASRAAVVRGMARIPLVCAGNAICRGILRLQSAPARQATAARSSKARRLVTYGTGAFKIAPGHRQTMKVKLSTRGRRLVKRRRVVRVYANVATRGAKTVTKRITLTRSAR
jgi:hypothetical protein